MKRLLFIALGSFLLSPLPLRAASPVVISEFMADNTRTLFDEDGDSEDWIEIRNVSDAPVNLFDWSLTDAPGSPRKWRFPATNLNVGAHLVVFASNKDRRTPGRPLHTNFRLDPDGEYLALVEPDGATVASAFSPRYPFQVPNVSFGIGLVSSNTTLLAAGAISRVLVPTPGNGGSALGDTWKGGTEPFNDAGWRAGTTGIGFSAAGAPSLVAAAAMTVRLNFDAPPAGTVIADTKPIGAAIHGANGAGAAGATWLASSADNAPVPLTRAGVMQFNSVENDQITLPGNAAFNTQQGTISFWMRSFGFFGPAQGPAVIFDRETISGNLTSGGLLFQNPDGRLQFIAYTNGLVAASATTVSSPSDDRWHHVAVTYDRHATGTTRLFIDGVQEVSVANTRGWAWPTAQQIELGRSHEPAFRKYNGLLDDFRLYNQPLPAADALALAQGDGGVPSTDLGANIESEMLNVNSSAFLRVPFNVADTNAFSLLTLRVRHDDGFVAWINGILVASVHAPDPLAWDSAATSASSSSRGSSVTIGNRPGLLKAGTNVLALQGLNVSASDPTFLVLPELIGTSVPVDSSGGLYFTQPTPGAANTGGTTNTGPAITEVTQLPNVPIDSEDVRVSARVTPTFGLVGGVTLRYRIMYANEVSVPMNDRGTDGDLAAGDGLWSALIPASASTNGQMIRYLVTAADTLGASSKWPLFYSPTNSEQYLGTIVDPTNVTSKLPIYHLFINPTDQAAADGENGARCAVFYDGEFYDNVRIELRGNTSAGFRKKAHRLEFNRDHRFRHLPGYPRIGDTSFLGESADPAYMRQAFSFWICDALGVPSPFSYPVRLQNNGVFYQLALHSDVMGIEQLERLGYEPHGALYKAAGQIVPSFASTGGFEKRTRLFEDRSDYLALANGINESQNLATRATNVFDMLDVPNVINYLTAARWVTEADDVWANMTIYRDSEGDQLWRIIPFDMNVSWGQLYCGDSLANFNAIIATNDNFKSHPLYGGQTVLPTTGGANWNRLYDSMVRIPATREMLLRRMRSLLDEFVLPPDLHPSAYTMEQRFLSFSNSVYTESILDRLRWGWEANPGSANGPYCYGTNVWMTNHLRDIITQYVVPRRRHWYVTHSITNTARAIGIANANNAGIPLTQPGNAVISVTQVEYNPSGGNQDEEYICLTNANPYAVDLSDWKLGGGVEFTFKGGTVMPSNSVLYVSPNTRAFRNRAVAPRGGMGLFVVGPYRGQLSARGEPLTITDKGGRLVYTNFFQGNPSGPQAHLRITELMYNPSPLNGNTNDAQEFEYVELRNISTTDTISLAGVRFINGISFDFTGSAVSSLAPGARVLVVKNLAAFTARYGPASVAGQYTLTLDNAGERLQLIDAANEEIHDFTYNNSWYRITDGGGFSLVVSNDLADTGLWNRREGWRPNGALNGAPGQIDPPAPTFAGIIVNEVLTHTDPPQIDAIELHNPTAGDVNLGGWFLSDDFNVPKKYRIPNGTMIPAGGHISFDEGLLNNAATALIPFALNSTGDDVWLFSGDANTNLTGYVFGEDFGASATGVSFGRYTNSVGDVHFVAQSANSLNAANAGPRVGPVVISEIMYHPPDLPDGTDNDEDEYLELRNLSSAPVPLFNSNSPADTWRLRGGIDYEFPPGVTLPTDGLLLLVSFNTLEARKLAAFRARYDVPAEVPVYGPYRGQLDNSTDDLRLERPDNPEGGEVPYIRVDRVEYRDTAPWPIEADGNVPSLQRLNASAYGNDPANWVAVGPSAGRPHVPGGTPPSITTQPANATAIVGRSASLSVAVAGTPPFFYQWRFNGGLLHGANGPVLNIPVLQPDQAGVYNVSIFNSAGSVRSADALISVLFPPSIVLQPTNRAVRIRPDPQSAPTTNTTFVTAASSINSALSYQWRFNGVNIPGATSPTLTVTNVQLESEGLYSCAISDSVDTVETVGARLTPWIAPAVVQPPVGQVIAAGSDFTMSVEVSGHPPPFGYSWRRGSVVISSNNTPARRSFATLNSTSAGLILTNNILASNYTMRLVVFNEANSSPGLLMTFTNAILADLDRDGLPDAIEESLGLSTNNPADAASDLDGDTMSNYAEYIAGTDPTNRLSYLKIDSITATGVATLAFGAVSNKTYAVEYTDALGSGPWLRLTDLVARPMDRVETAVDAGFTTNRFYRLVTPR